MIRFATLLAFLLLTLGGGTLVGLYNMPGEWYEGLTKPFFNPPNWIFGPVWTFLYILIAFAGWRTWERRAEGPAMQIWFGQLGLNFLWPSVFFSAELPGAALIVILVMLGLILYFIKISWTRDRVSAWLFLPYAVWVAFATLLNAALFTLN